MYIYRDCNCLRLLCSSVTSIFFSFFFLMPRAVSQGECCTTARKHAFKWIIEGLCYFYTLCIPKRAQLQQLNYTYGIHNSDEIGPNNTQYVAVASHVGLSTRDQFREDAISLHVLDCIRSAPTYCWYVWKINVKDALFSAFDWYSYKARIRNRSRGIFFLSPVCVQQ